MPGGCEGCGGAAGCFCGFLRGGGLAPGFGEGAAKDAGGGYGDLDYWAVSLVVKRCVSII